MSKMKRIMSILLAFVMVLGLIPGMSLTAFAATVYEYALWIGTTQVTIDNAADVLGDGTVSYNPDTYTVILKDADIPYIKSNLNNLTIELIGNNTVGGNPNDRPRIGIVTNDENSSLTIQGDGTLSVAGSTRAIEAFKNLTISGGKITAASDSSYGIYSNSGNITINGGTFTVPSDSNYGIYSLNGNITISDGEINVTAKKMGLFADGDITISGGKITDASNSYYGIYSLNGNITISDGEINITTEGRGLYSGSDITISDGEINVRAKRMGLFASGDLTISGGKITAVSDSEDGIYSGNKITISNGDITAESKKSGLHANVNITVNGGKITTTSDSSYSILCDHDITINGGTFTVKSDSSYGIYSRGGNITISDGEINVTAKKDNGLCASGDITISGGKITAVSDSKHGIISQQGKINISDGEVNASSAKIGLYAQSDLIISGGKIAAASDLSYGIYSEKGDIKISGGEITGTSENSFCIAYLEGSIAISGGKITAASVSNDGIISQQGKINISDGEINVRAKKMGLFASGDITISGGKITAASVSRYGIYSEKGDIKISSGEIKSTSEESFGIASIEGSITISGGKITAASDKSTGMVTNVGDITISGGEVTAIGSSYGLYSPKNIVLQNGMKKLEAKSEKGAENGFYPLYSNSDITYDEDKLKIIEPENGKTGKKTVGGANITIIYGNDGTIPSHVIIEAIYAVTKAEAANGSFTVSPETALAGDTITVTATPNTGYAVDTMTYTDSEGTVYDFTSAGTFTMPASDVTVSVTFKKSVQSVTLDKTEASLTAGDQVALTATVLPADAADRTVKWSVGGTNADAVKLYSDQACTREVGADVTSTLTVYAKGLSAGDAAVNVASNEDSTISASCALTIAEAAGSYSQKSSQGAEHTLGEDKDAVYTITNSADDNRAYERFTQVSMDGKVIAAENYTKAKGSLVLTLKSAYLNKLAVGEHKVKISFSDGEVNTSLKILEPAPTPTPTPTPTSTPTPTPKPVPKTGDASMPFLWIGLILTGMLGIGILTAVRRRK